MDGHLIGPSSSGEQWAGAVQRRSYMFLVILGESGVPGEHASYTQKCPSHPGAEPRTFSLSGDSTNHNAAMLSYINILKALTWCLQMVNGPHLVQCGLVKSCKVWLVGS